MRAGANNYMTRIENQVFLDVGKRERSSSSSIHVATIWFTQLPIQSFATIVSLTC